MCDPRAKLGAIKTFQKAKEVDDYLDLLCISMTTIAHKQYRVFIANDDVDQSAIDHYIIMEDNYGLDIVKKDFKEVDTQKVASANNTKLHQREKIIRPRVQTVRT